MRSPLDLIQVDFPSTPSAIFGHKGLSGDDLKSQGTHSDPASPLREKNSLPTSTASLSRSPSKGEDSEVKDELSYVLGDMDHAMSELYVNESTAIDNSSSVDPPYPGSPIKHTSMATQNFQHQTYPPQLNQMNAPNYGYVPYGAQPQQLQQQQYQQVIQDSQGQYSAYPQIQGQHPPLHYQPQYQAHQMQTYGLRNDMGGDTMLMGQQHLNPNAGGYIPQRGQMPGGAGPAGLGAYHMQPGMGVFDMTGAQTVNGGMPGLTVDQQNGYYMNVMPANQQQPMYVDPYYQTRVQMQGPNNGGYPHQHADVAYATNGAGEGLSFVQFGHPPQPPNAVGSYWAPQGALTMLPGDHTQMHQQAAMMMQRGQGRGGGMYMTPEQQQQYNTSMSQMTQQQMTMMSLNAGRNMGGMMPAHLNSFPQQQLQGGPGGYVNTVPSSPARGNSSNMQSPPSPSKLSHGHMGMQDGGMGGGELYRQDSNEMLNDANVGHMSPHHSRPQSSSAGDRRAGFNVSRGGLSNGGRGSPVNNATALPLPAGGSVSGGAGPAGAVSRDTVVEDFRNTYGKGRQWEIRDLVGHVVAFCQDQHGSRFIQQRLEVAADPDKQIVFDEVLPCAHSLMTDVFGNYVIQKLFEFGTPDQCETLAALLMGQAVPLALQMYGCRVIQKALEYVATPRLVALVGEFEGQQVLRCVHDQNGNHVIQKCIEVVSRVAKESQTHETEYLSSRIQFIIQAFSGRVRELSMHPYGCRVVQRILEHCTNTQKAPVLDELRKCCRELIQDQYGNYVIQHVMQHGWETDKAILIDEVQSRLLEYSQHKFASNVVEKCIQYADKKDRDQMIWTIINVTFDLNSPVDAKTGQCVLENMVRDPYANYVVQKVIDVSDAGQRGAIIRYMRENIVQLRRYTYGKHIIIRLEKVSGEKF